MLIRPGHSVTKKSRFSISILRINETSHHFVQLLKHNTYTKRASTHITVINFVATTRIYQNPKKHSEKKSDKIHDLIINPAPVQNLRVAKIFDCTCTRDMHTTHINSGVKKLLILGFRRILYYFLCCSVRSNVLRNNNGHLSILLFRNISGNGIGLIGSHSFSSNHNMRVL